MSRTLPLTRDFDVTKKIGIVILDDEVQIGVNDIISVEFVTTTDKKLRLDSFSIIDGSKYCAFRESAKDEIKKMQNIPIVMTEAKEEKKDVV